MNNDTIIVKLDKERTLKFRRRELKMLEISLNKNLSKIDFSDMSVDEVTKMIHLGLVHEDLELKLEKVEELLDNSESPFGEVIKDTMDAFSIAMGGGKVDISDKTQEVSEKN